MITDPGRTALRTREPLPRQGPELIRWWVHNWAKQNLVLDYLATQPDHHVAIEEIAEHPGYSPTSGGFRNSLSRLRSRGARPRNTTISTHLLT